MAQEQLGARLDNYMGLEQAWLNPALPAIQPTTVSIHLAGIGVYGSNNYGYIKNANVFSFGNETSVVTHKSLEGQNPPPKTLVSDLYDKSKKTYVKLNATLSGPSVLLKINQQHSLGVFLNFRAAFSLTKIPVNLGYHAYNRHPYNEAFTLTPFGAAGAIWHESGIHYGYSFENSDWTFALGVNLKYNRLSESVFFSLNQSLPYTKLNKDSIYIEQPDVHFAFTTPNIDQFNWSELDQFKPKFNFYGKGFSTDLGFVMQKSTSQGYQYRLGVSLLDFGVSKIKQARYHNSSPIPREITIDFVDLKNTNTIQELESKLSKIAFKDSTASLKGSSFSLGMPAAISIQGDYQIAPNYFLGGVIVQPIRLFPHQIERSTTFAIQPRYERRFFSFSMPILLSEWQSVRMGVAARLGFLSIGTDDVGSFLVKKDFTGSDVYLHLGFNITNWRKQKNKWGHHKKSKLGCFDF